MTISAQLTDANGNAVATSGKTVTWSKSNANGSFATATSTTDASGIATISFTTHTVSATATTVTATDNSSFTGTTPTITTATGAATAAAITTQPTGAASGSTLATQPVIRIVDANGNTVTSSSVSVVASIASGSGTLSGTTTVTASSGIATFTNLVITGTAGNFTLTFTPTSLTPVTSSALTIIYAIGDTGPGGGKIFYYSAGGFNCGADFTSTGSPTGGLCHYLEAAPNTWWDGVSDPQRVWGEWRAYVEDGSWACFGGDSFGQSTQTLSAIGTGYKNSLDVIQNANNYWLLPAIFQNSAVAAVRAYAGGSKSDWFLPSIDELNELYSHRQTVGGFANGIYWSSTEYDLDCSCASLQNLGTQSIVLFVEDDYTWSIAPGTQEWYIKDDPFYVRPVRAF